MGTPQAKTISTNTETWERDRTKRLAKEKEKKKLRPLRKMVKADKKDAKQLPKSYTGYPDNWFTSNENNPPDNSNNT